jgi:hypothetical protein
MFVPSVDLTKNVAARTIAGKDEYRGFELNGSQ